MSSETDRPDREAAYERPERDGDATACAYTEYRERESVEGEVPATGSGAGGLERRVWDALYGVEDPEMPVSIVDLGLIYGLEVDEETGAATVEMTLTYTGCPARDMLLGEVEDAVADVKGVEDAEVVLVWSPPWEVGMVTEPGREALREFGLSV